LDLKPAILESELSQAHAIDSAITKLFLNTPQTLHFLREKSETHAKKQKKTFSFGISMALLLIFFLLKT
jgi:hypothetical protein